MILEKLELLTKESYEKYLQEEKSKEETLQNNTTDVRTDP